MIRLLKLKELNWTNTSKIVLSDNLMNLNYSSSIIFIPIKYENLIFHIILSEQNIDNINYYISFYNKKTN